MMQIRRAGVAFLLVLSFILSAHAAQLPEGFVEVLVARNLDPTAMALAPDGRIFVAEKNGRVLVVEGGMLLDDPLVVLDVDNYNERGLSGIAVHPEFSVNGYVYLYYTVKDANHNRVSRFTVEENHILPGSEEILINIDPLNGYIHNAGSMAFGQDGKLYISIGDGSNGVAPQELNSLLGKILRVNDDGTIPEDNPFYDIASGIYRSIYALGLRNSFSMAVQPGTGRIFATEVGSFFDEEVNEILPGRNYGWPIVEGYLESEIPPANYLDPVYSYPHSEGCAAVGAAFYNPDDAVFPAAYRGKFFYADYCQGYIRYMDPDTPMVIHPFASGINRPLNFLVAPDGTMYYLARAGIGGGSEEDNTASTNGTLWRILYTGSGSPFVAVDPQDVLIPVGEDASFTTLVSGSHPLFYQWQQNSFDIPGATSDAYVFANAIYADSGSVFRCIISNLNGTDTTSQATLHVTTDTRPAVQITMPVEGSRYRAGETLAFEGTATDLEDGSLDSSSYRWRIDFHHDEHTHPGLPPTVGITGGSFPIPQVGETAVNVWYKIHLTATDSRGLSRTVSREVHPVLTQFVVRTIPDGIPVVVDAHTESTPAAITSVAGVIRTIEAPLSVETGDSILVFREWVPGGNDPILAFAAEGDTVTYTARYEGYAKGEGTGITGRYYDMVPGDPTFIEPPAFTRIDEKVDFNWDWGSPDENALGLDYWMVRWEGGIEAIMDDTYTFSIISDDGARLWINDQLVIDAWVPQAPTEWTGTFDLPAGLVLPIRVEYFEFGGGATCQLLWRTNKLQKHVVPRSQLFPEVPSSTSTLADIPILVYPNPASTDLYFRYPDDFNMSVRAEVHNVLGQLCLQENVQLVNGQGLLHIDDLPAGIYALRCNIRETTSQVVSFVKSN